MYAVEVAQLRKAYGNTVAVDEISFAARSHDITAIIGPNGAGKTTTIDICCGLRRPDSGRVIILGQPPTSRELEARVGVMPQAGGSSASGVYPSARVRETLAHHAAFYAHPHDVDALLERLDLLSRAKTPWRRLSGGEQQRLSFALAIVGRPELVFLDEPSAGLDVRARQTMRDLVREMQAAGVTVILTTHDMSEAGQLADHVVIISDGTVIADGSPRDLTANSARTTLSFVSAAGLPTHEFDTTGLTMAEPSPGHYTVTGDIDADAVAAVTAWCARHGAMPDRLSTGASDLESAYLDLTGHPKP